MHDRNILRCPNCSNTAPHIQVFNETAPERGWDSDGNVDENVFSVDHELFRCETCQGLSLYTTYDVEGKRELAWPRSETLHEAVPESVAENYYEAKKVQELSPNAFTVLIRRALEALCDDRGVGSGTLFNRLKILTASGELPSGLSSMTSVLRELGNTGAHHSDTKLTVPLTWALDDFFKVVVEYVYVAPKKLEDFNKRLEEQRRRKAKRGEQDGADQPAAAVDSKSE